MTESHVAAYSALAEREHLCRERCRVVASVEDGQPDTHIDVHYSTGSIEERERERERETRGRGRATRSAVAAVDRDIR